MEVEKKRSKGGFLNLFDWNGKSRKRLFSSSNELSGLKQGKENVENLSKPQLFEMEAIDDGASSSSYKLNGDWDFVLTKTSDEKCGGRVPSVVARLMGLDSLPSNVPEPCSTPYLESRSVRASHHDNSNGVWNGHSVDYIDMPNKLERFSGNLLDYRAQKIPKSPIERFQTEVLPPRSAKSIPITHHKLLSPIKSPGFTPTMNTGYLMEAATKIIDASPRKPVKSKMTSINNSSVPLRIRDLKEKVETARKLSGTEKPTENYPGKYRKGRPSDRNYSGSEHLLASRMESAGADKSNSNTSKDKGRPVSVAVQSRGNLHSKGDSTSCSDTTSMDQKEHNEVKSSQIFKSQPSMQKAAQKRTMKRNNNVLAQNNQKQNSLPNKEKLPSKPPVLNQPVKRSQSANCNIGPSKTVNKVVLNSEVESKITRTRETDAKKEFASSKRNNTALRKKRSVSQDVSSEGSSVSNALIRDGERSVKYNIAVDGSMNCEENRKLGMDVISFTFTSPLKKSISEPCSDEAVKINHSLVFDSCSENDYLKNLSSFSPNLNVINGDALSVLLEQKLQELTCRVESSQSCTEREGIFECSGSNLKNVFAMSGCDKEENDMSCIYSDSPHDCDPLSTDSNDLVFNKWQQGVKEMKELDDSNKTETVTVSRSSIEDEFSPDTRNSIHGSVSSSVSRSDAIKVDPTNVYPRMLGEVFNSASTIDDRDKFRNQSPTMSSPIHIHRSDDWELQYVRDVLSKAELAFENFTLGAAPRAISPSLYNSLDIEENNKDGASPECFKLERKALFDCVNECLELKFKQIVVGNSKTRVPWAKLFENGSLAEELWREIEGWKCMEEWMVDELVDKDMSTQHGKWLNFDQEAYEEGLQIEKRILTSLVNELVSDLLITG